MVDRNASEHGKQEAFDRAVTDPEPISGSESGTPRPDTTSMNPDTSSLAGMDPDFGLDPHTPAAGYGGTDRGRTEMTNYTEPRTLGMEGDYLAGGGVAGAAGADVGGTAQAGDTTSDADSYSNLDHGLGEAEVGLNMPQGVTAPAASDNPPAGGTQVPAPGPSDATAQATGLQSTRSPRE